MDVFLFKGSSQIKLKANSQFSIIVCQLFLKEFLLWKSFPNLTRPPYLSVSLQGPAIALRQRKKGRRAQASLNLTKIIVQLVQVKLIFLNLENVLSPEGRCVAYPVGVQLRLFPFIEFWVRRGILDFKTYLLKRPFFCFKIIIPRREMRSISSRSPIETPSIYWILG